MRGFCVPNANVHAKRYSAPLPYKHKGKCSRCVEQHVGREGRSTELGNVELGDVD